MARGVPVLASAWRVDVSCESFCPAGTLFGDVGG